MNKWNVESEDTYSAFFGYFHLPYATLSIAFFFPEEPQSNNLAAGTLSRGGIWQLWTTIFYKCQTVPFILLWKHYYTTMEPLQFHQYFVMSGDKRAFCAPEDLYCCWGTPTQTLLSRHWQRLITITEAPSIWFPYQTHKYTLNYTSYFALCAYSVLINISFVFWYLFFHNRNEINPISWHYNLNTFCTYSM